MIGHYQSGLFPGLVLAWIIGLEADFGAKGEFFGFEIECQKFRIVRQNQPLDHV